MKKILNITESLIEGTRQEKLEADPEVQSPYEEKLSSHAKVFTSFNKSKSVKYQDSYNHFMKKHSSLATIPSNKSPLFEKFEE
jgi:hypothetical protein